jgi:hypothetical protein
MIFIVGPKVLVFSNNKMNLSQIKAAIRARIMSNLYTLRKLETAMLIEKLVTSFPSDKGSFEASSRDFELFR